MPAITASISPRNSGRRPSSCAPVPRACAISAPAIARPTPSIFQGSRPCRCGWRGMSRTPGRSWRSWRERGGLLGQCTRACRAIPTTPWPQRLLPKGAGSIVSFGIAGGRPPAKVHRQPEAGLASRQCRRRQDAGHSSGEHDPSADDATQLASAGIGEDMIRLSVGLEEADDIIADLAQALRAAQKG